MAGSWLGIAAKYVQGWLCTPQSFVMAVCMTNFRDIVSTTTHSEQLVIRQIKILF